MPEGPDAGVADVEAAEAGSAGVDTYRKRIASAASARGIPLATILTAVVVVVAVVDLDILVVALAWVLRTILLYGLMALFLGLFLSGPVRLLRRAGLPHGLAVTVVFGAAILGFAGAIGLVTPHLVHAVTEFARNLPHTVADAENGRGTIGHLLTRLHLEKWVQANAPKLATDVKRSLKPAQALSVGAAAFSTVVAIGTIAILSLFLLWEGPALERGILGLFSETRAKRIHRVYKEASRSVMGFIYGDALTSVIAGLVVFVTALIVGLPYPLLLGLWVALVDLLPLVGGLLAGVPVAVVGLFHSLPAFITIVVVFLVYQQIENHILNPVIMSRTVRLSPLWVLLSVLTAATLGGRVGSGLGAFVGALIGIPTGGAVQIVIREIRRGPGAATPEVAGVGVEASPMLPPMRVLVIIPTYKEAMNIERILRKVRDVLPEAGLLVVDDGSPDGTAEIVDGLVSELGDLHVLRREKKSGLGSAYRAGFAWGMERGYTACVEMDADFSHNPETLPELLAPLARGHEVSIGSRYVKGGTIPNWSWYRHLLSWGGNRYASLVLGLGVADSTAGFRAYSTSLLSRMDLSKIKAEGYGFQIEMTFRAKQHGATIEEIPIAFVDRVEGESKMSSKIVIEALGLVTKWGIGRLFHRSQRRESTPVLEEG